jgi:hypothetical protein
MNANEKKENVGKSESPASSSPGNGPGVTTARESLARKTEPSARSELVDDKTTAPSLTRKATGPRTSAGKRRTRINALKSGIFANVLLLAGDSRAEYKSLVEVVREDLQPQGRLESVVTDNIVALLWRKRRFLQAESTEVAKAAEFITVDSIQAQQLELWDCLRAGEASGGILRHGSNVLVIQEAISMLTTFRNSFEECGFQKDMEPWCLRKLYGVDQNGAAPFGIYRTYQIYSKVATDAPEGNDTPDTSEVLKKVMVRIIDQEIERFKKLEAMQRDVDEQKRAYQTIAALIPSQDVLDRFVRYEAHLSREIDRSLNLLERLQRRRLGLPALPAVRVELSK